MRHSFKKMRKMLQVAERKEKQIGDITIVVTGRQHFPYCGKTWYDVPTSITQIAEVYVSLPTELRLLSPKEPKLVASAGHSCRQQAIRLAVLKAREAAYQAALHMGHREYVFEYLDRQIRQAENNIRLESKYGNIEFSLEECPVRRNRKELLVLALKDLKNLRAYHDRY